MKFRLPIAAAALVLGTSVLAATPTVMTLQPGGTSVPQASPKGGEALTSDELDLSMMDGDSAGSDSAGSDRDGLGFDVKAVINRSIFRGRPVGGLAVSGAARAKSNPQ